MERLDPENRLFTELENGNPEWWQLLKDDREIYIDIRKENKIDIYYNGGAIFRNLRHDGNTFLAETHYKYLLPEKANYINISLNQMPIYQQDSNVQLLDIESLEEVLPRIKANIGHHYSASSEKGIQARFVLKSGGFIDSEFQCSFVYENVQKTARIDLTWIDINNQEIIMTELKTIGDPRLYDGDITLQLTKYMQFIELNGERLLDYYQRLFLIKQQLGLVPEPLRHLESLEGFIVQEKPLLLFGDCNKKWIANFADDIRDAVQNVAFGSYFSGKPEYNCDRIIRTNRNRHIY